MLQDRKRQNRRRNATGSAPQKNEQPCTTAPRPHYVVTKLSSINLRISSFALLSGRPREREPFSLPPRRFLRAFRWSRPPALSAGVALRLPASATHVLQMRFVSWSSNMLPHYSGAARHNLPDRRGHEGFAAFCLVDGTVHRPHKGMVRLCAA